MKKTAVVAGAVIGAAILLVVADYFAYFGTTRTEQLDLITMNFITVDEETGAPVTGVHARCFQSNNNNACSERSGGDPGTVSVSIPVMKIVTKSFIFVQNTTLRETADSKLKIMFVHADYANPVETFLVSELPEQSTRPLTVTMPKSLANKY
jgi:hypothetical protein